MKVDDIEIPDVWCGLLHDLQQVDPHAVIAGGAIRDLYCGHEPKDLDFFSTNFQSSWGPADESGMDYEGMEYVQGVCSYKFKDAPPINVVIVSTVSLMVLLESFDLGICQIAFDGNAIHKTPAFDWDFKHSIITMRRIDRYRRSINRFCRINQKFNVELAIPQLDELNAQPK